MRLWRTTKHENWGSAFPIKASDNLEVIANPIFLDLQVYPQPGSSRNPQNLLLRRWARQFKPKHCRAS